MTWQEIAALRLASAAACRSDLAAPMIIRDGLENVVNPCDGKTYDSKSSYYRVVKDAGCVIVGNEAEKMAKGVTSARPKVTPEEIAVAVEKVKAGYKPGLERDKDFDSWL